MQSNPTQPNPNAKAFVRTRTFRSNRYLARVVPFFFSAVLYLSAVFVVFSPIPLIFQTLQANILLAVLALAVNSIFVYIASGLGSTLFFAIFIGTVGIILPYFLKRGKSLERSATITFLIMVISMFAIAGLYYLKTKVNPMTVVTSYVTEISETLWKSSPSQVQTNFDVEGPEELTKNFLVELPSAIAIFALILICANILVVLRLAPYLLVRRRGIDPQIVKKWKAPDYLVWPTIAAGALVLLTGNVAHDIAQGFLKFFLAIYALQGLSVLSFYFDVWKVRGIFRNIGFVIAVFLMMPLVLFLGFFDLWFDFRSKIRQL